MARGTVDGAVIEVMNLADQHLTDREESGLIRTLQGFAQVQSAEIVRNVLLVTVDMGNLQGIACYEAVEVLKARIKLQVERCKLRHVRAVRV